MEHTAFYPKSRDDILNSWKNIHINKSKHLLTLVNSGTGSGKTKLIIDIANRNIPNFCPIFIFASESLQTQAEEAMEKSTSNNAEIYDARNMNWWGEMRNFSEDVIKKIKDGKKVAIFDHNLGHNSGKYTKNARAMFKIINDLRSNNINILVLFDEIHLQFASITGGSQIRIDMNRTNTSQYKKYRETSHLNIPLKLQKEGIPIIGLSATLNNLICSKIPLLALDLKKTRILNFHPIQNLYSELKIQPAYISCFRNCIPYLEQAEREPNKKILLVFPNTKLLDDFTKYYKKYFNKDISGVDWTCKTTLERRNKLEFKEKLKKAKYILSCDLLNTGFDLSTYVEGEEFNLLILFRELSDKTSNPLSGNPENILYSELSANFIQVISRLRTGGLVLIDADKFRSPSYSLYDMQSKLTEIIEKGVSKWENTCSFEAMSEMERYYLCRLIAIIDNYRNDEDRERKAVQTFLDLTYLKYNRNFISESKGENMDWSFWIQAFEWYITNEISSFSDSCQEPAKTVSYPSGNSLAGGTTIVTENIISSEETASAGNVETVSAGDVETVSAENVETVSTGDVETVSAEDVETVSAEDVETVSTGDVETVSTGDVETVSTGDVETVSASEAILSIEEKEEPNTITIPTANPIIETVVPSFDFSGILETGGGEGQTRLKDLEVEQMVIERSNGICGHCSRLFLEGEDKQVSHIRRYDDNGDYKMDNLMYTHRSCDGLFDSREIIWDRDGTFWFRDISDTYSVDYNQYCHISKENIRARWEWQKKTLVLGEIFTDTGLRKKLTERSYKHFDFDSENRFVAISSD